MQSLGEQLLLAAEDAQYGSGGRVGPFCDQLDRHLLERMREEERARAFENALLGRRSRLRARAHHIGSCRAEFNVIDIDIKLNFMSTAMSLNKRSQRPETAIAPPPRPAPHSAISGLPNSGFVQSLRAALVLEMR